MEVNRYGGKSLSVPAQMKLSAGYSKLAEGMEYLYFLTMDGENRLTIEQVHDYIKTHMSLDD